jgi:hypothetical protein
MQAADLRVQAGLKFGPGPLQFLANPSIDVAVTASGSTDGSTRHHQTDATGFAQTTLTPSGGTLQVALRSCINDAVGGLVSIVGLTLLDVCRDTSVSRNVGDIAFYENNFSTPAGPEWSNPVTRMSPSGEQFLGHFTVADHFRDTVAVQLRLDALPAAHTELTIEFDLYIMGHWDGSAPTPGGPDIFTFRAGGTIVKRTTFANDNDDPQAFPGNHPGGSSPYGTGSIAQNSLGYIDLSPGNYSDTIYRLRYTIPHIGPSILFEWTASIQCGMLTPGSIDHNCERFGLDNVRVTVR